MESEVEGKFVLLNLILWIIPVFVYRSEYFKRTNIKGSYGLIGLTVIVYVTFAFSSLDTYNYEYIYDEMLLYKERIHVEEFYYWLLQLLPSNYYLWRMAIWGTAALIYIKVCKINKLDSRVVSFIFPLLLLQQFSITRGCLGIALFLLGISFFFKQDRRNITLYLWVICAIVASSFLHNSMPLFIAIAALAFIPLNKKTFILLLILFPILREVVIPFAFDFIGHGFFNEDTISFATSYLEREKTEANFNGILRTILEYTPRFLIFYILIKCFIFREILLPKNIRFFFNYSFLLFYIALLFFGQETSSFIASRTIHIMCFTLLIPVVYYLMYMPRTRLVKVTMLLIILYDLMFDYIYQIIKCW